MRTRDRIAAEGHYKSGSEGLRPADPTLEVLLDMRDLLQSIYSAPGGSDDCGRGKPV